MYIMVIFIIDIVPNFRWVFFQVHLWGDPIFFQLSIGRLIYIFYTKKWSSKDLNICGHDMDLSHT
jgi:hypothetical protein